MSTHNVFMNKKNIGTFQLKNIPYLELCMLPATESLDTVEYISVQKWSLI